VTGGFRRAVSLVDRIERQLINTNHLTARAVWSELYRKAIREEIHEGEVRAQEGYLSCSYCQTSNIQTIILNSSSQHVHPVLCHHCGREGNFCTASGPTTCPICDSAVETGERFSEEEQLRRLLRRCQIIIPTLLSDSPILILGKRANQHLAPHLKEDSFITILDGPAENTGQDLLSVLSESKKIFLHTYFESALTTNVTLLVAKYLFSLNLDVVPIVRTPPTIEGRGSIQKVMSIIQELQFYFPQTILVSGSILTRFPDWKDLHDKHIPAQILEAINCYTKG
jgi:hypothetical protein